jgi:beta-galactosidase
VQVEIYSDAEEATLFLNGKEIGRKPVGKTNRFKALFETVYTPGRLEAAAYTGGKETGRFILSTAESDVELAITSDHEKLILDCGDLAYITINLTDKAGVVNMAAEKKIHVKVEGSGVLQGFGSANPVTKEPYTDTEHITFEVRALAVIRPIALGKITVAVEAERCAAKVLMIEVKENTR